MKYRLWNHFRAMLGGYFWLPCPLCGQMTGGHEWSKSDYASIPTNKSYASVGICLDCTKEKKLGKFSEKKL
jgi:hypothetical protein